MSSSSLPTIVIVSDSNKLGRVLALNLSDYGEVIQVTPDSPPADNRRAAGEVGLIIVALSAPDSEPLVALAKASLGFHLGRTPILIISDREFSAEPVEHIGHLSFPFSNEALHRAVAALLAQTDRPNNSEPNGWNSP